MSPTKNLGTALAASVFLAAVAASPCAAADNEPPYQVTVTAITGTAGPVAATVRNGASEIDVGKADAIIGAATQAGVRTQTITVAVGLDGVPSTVRDERGYLAEVLVGPARPEKAGMLDLGINVHGEHVYGLAKSAFADTTVTVKAEGRGASITVDEARFAGAMDGFDVFTSGGNSVQLPNVARTRFSGTLTSRERVLARREGDTLFLTALDKGH